MSKNTRKKKIIKKKFENRKAIKAIKKRQKSQEVKIFRTQLRTEFSKVFGKDITGILFFC